MGTEEAPYTSYVHAEDGGSDEESSSHAPRNGNDHSHGGHRRKGSWSLGGVVDPQSRWVQEWNRVFVLVCTAGLVVDPLFFYALSISGARMCLFVDGWFAITVTALRCMTDAVHIWNMWMRLKTSYRTRRLRGAQEGQAPMSPRAVAVNYLKSKKGFFFDLFIIFPVPQVVLWVAAPVLIRRGLTTMVMTVFLIMFLFQYLPKIYHCICFLRRLQNSSGYIFGTIWWGIALNLIAYFAAAHLYYMKFLTMSNVKKSNRYHLALLTLESSTFGGGLESTTEWHEILFNIIVITAGLLLVTMLIGNIKVFLHSATSKKQALHLKMRSLDWWMRKRQLPKGIRQRVRQYERQRWAAMRGVDECKMIQDLPEGLRKEIKYHLCLDLVRQVPLFQHMDELVLENICDRVKSLIFPKGETITREGDPVQRMLFIVRGHLQSSQVLRDGIMSCCMLGPGNFSGDELLSWCLRRPFIERLPPSSSTLVTLETTEAFSLEASDVKYVTQNFRYTFVNEKVKRSARYYSPGWRTWAAVAIQLAWRRCKHRLTLASLSFIRPRRPASRCSSLGEERLRHYAALLTSPKPNQDDLP
ncbi:cAMP-dependent protein kinase regulatory subunit [Cocos nucifera]|uniref:cAMP-dependent protein kinase regulatory subunit n=1 Tax=Cocos nucifera TaxID=13894 RepID=A0A8K0IC25_COCNU|nr:cAMP-dependent protein kinase regulatory subunit [Cocos nucifera]